MKKFKLFPGSIPRPYFALSSWGVLILLIFSAGLYLWGPLDAADYSLQDALYYKDHAIHTQIVIVAIDEASLVDQGQWPWSRSTLARLIETIEAGQPKSLGLDVLLTEKSQLPADDRILAQTLGKYKNIVLPVAAIFNDRSLKQGVLLQAQQIIKPHHGLLVNPATKLGHINVIPDAVDGVVRRFEPYVGTSNQAYPSFAEALYAVANNSDQPIFTQESQSPIINFVGPANSFGMLSATDVLSGAVDAQYFENAYVLVGPTAIGLLEDRYWVGTDKSLPMSGIEIHANILQNIIERDSLEPSFLKESGLFQDLGVLVLVLMLLGCIGYLFKGNWNIPLGLIGLGFFVLCAIYINTLGIRIPLLYTLLGGFLVLLYINGIRAIASSREKRRIRQLFSKYVSPEVVDQILTMTDASMLLVGQRRTISALFVDVRGFTTLSEKVEPETVVHMLNAYLSLTSQAVFAQQGTVDKFIGDATMALFNAPLDQADHAIRAARAALSMQRGAVALAADLERDFGVSLSFGIGIHTGLAIVGNIGSQHRLDYTAIGDTVNTAARLEGLAPASEIYVSADFAKAISMSDSFKCEYVKESPLKGKADKVAIYRLLDQQKVD